MSGNDVEFTRLPYGSCPQQCTGTVGGEPFYWRLRDGYWDFGCGSDPVAIVEGRLSGFRRSGDISGMADGWLPSDVVADIVCDLCMEFVAEKESKGEIR